MLCEQHPDDRISLTEASFLKARFRGYHPVMTYLTPCPLISCDMLLLFCIIGAEKVQLFSKKKADDILIPALKKYSEVYKINEKYVEFAARAYCSDKGLDVLLMDFKFPRSLNDAWQISVVEANLTRLANELIG